MSAVNLPQFFKAQHASLPHANRQGLAWFSLVPLWLSSAVSLAAITITDGPVSPPYPGTNPDPWAIGAELDLDESTLLIDGGSSVTATTLYADGRVLVNSAGLLDVDAITLLTGPGGGNSGAAFHLDGGNVDAGRFSPVDNAVLYVGVDNGGIFTTDTAGAIGLSSTITLALDNGGRFLGMGNTRFGGDTSSFSLGPPLQDPSAYSPDLASITSLVTVAKAAITDGAMANSTAATGGSGIAGLGNDSVFRIDGDMLIGGASSDGLIHLNDGSSFEVTGALTAPGSSSIMNLLVVDSDFDVGGDFNLMNGDTGSATFAVFRSEFDVGGALAMPTPAGSAFTMTIEESPFMILGPATLQIGSNTAEDITFRESTVTVGGDFSVGGALADNSALSYSAAGSDHTVNGDMRLRVGAASVMNTDLFQLGIDTAGSFLVSQLGNESVDVLNYSQVNITTGGSLVFERVGDTTSTLRALADITLDVAEDFQLTQTGVGADSTMVFERIDGVIGRDLSVLTGVSDSSNIHVMEGLDLTIGRDLTYRVTETTNPGEQVWAQSNSTLLIARNFVLGSDASALVADSSFTVGDTVLIEGELQSSNLTVDGDVSVAAGGTLRISVPPSGTPGEGLGVEGDLSFSAGGSVVLVLQGTTPNTVYQPINHNGVSPVTLMGDLLVELPSGMSSSALASQSIPLITSNLPITGAFQNVMIGDLVPTADGLSRYVLVASDAGDQLFLRQQAGPAPVPVMQTYMLAILIILMLVAAIYGSNRQRRE